MKVELLPAKGTKEEAEHFTKLVEMSAPEFFRELFGENVREIMKRLFLEGNNLFSHKHVIFAAYGGQIAGMLLGYSWKEHGEEKYRTGKLMMSALGWEFLKRLPTYISALSGSGNVSEGEFYISNVAVYPEFRGRKIGKSLMLHAEEMAKESEAGRMALDVEKGNEIAIAVYKKLGYSIEREHSVELEGRKYEFYRMVKGLKEKE